MKSFNSFDTFAQIQRGTPSLEMRLSECESYLAHTHKTKPPELLSEHTELVVDYALKLVQAHSLDPVFGRLIFPLLKHEKEKDKQRLGNFIKRLVFDAIFFHDFGKINENFQIEKMGNALISKRVENGIGSTHSALGAFIFLVAHLQELLNWKNLEDETQCRLFALIALFTNPILKHHATYLENNISFDSENIQPLLPYLQKFGLDWNADALNGVFQKLEENVADWNRDYISEEARFPIYALLKLTFSLLTAADYYATSSFMSDLKIEDFGVFTHQEKLRVEQQFRSSKNYNRDFFNHPERFSQCGFDDLQSCNPENLNVLRQKLMAEVFEKLQANTSQNIFYLEAPTGSGKTNISIGAAVELLKTEPALNKIFYVFPFTTLVTQTDKVIKETLGVSNAEVIQLHARSGFHSKDEEKQDGKYGTDKINYIDNLFVNYPITLLTHVRFFDILKGNGKAETYLLHRLANSIVIIDELQSYPPQEWDKVAYFIQRYAETFNIKFILMSATLPKLHMLKLGSESKEFVSLIEKKDTYFQNPNFKDRVRFDFSLLEKTVDIEYLGEFVLSKCESHARENRGKVKAVIEFIFKKSAGKFYHHVKKRAENTGYKVFLLSGSILEPRRREIIDFIKNSDKEQITDKILLVATQVIEAGVDIDMDIGFKDRSLIDSEEQLAGRVNRNARPTPATVFVFDLDKTYHIYGSDLRYKITRDSITFENYRAILQNKDFDQLYDKVCEQVNRDNEEDMLVNLPDYLERINRLQFFKVNTEFQLINEKSETVFVPLNIPMKKFSFSDQKFLADLGWDKKKSDLCGEWVWQCYLDIIHTKDADFTQRQVNVKRISGIMSQFMFSMFAGSHDVKELQRFCNHEYWEKYKMLYLEEWKKVYDYEHGLMAEKFNEPAFL